MEKEKITGDEFRALFKKAVPETTAETEEAEGAESSETVTEE